jgi:hypothetical protein
MKIFKDVKLYTFIMTHSLNIHDYSLEETFSLFHLDSSKINHITICDLKKAKQVCLSMHPDKSRLSSNYFLFYKKAFDIITEHYNNHRKVDQEITEKNTNYNNDSIKKENYYDTEQIKSQLENMTNKEFSEVFNQLFDDNMIEKIEDKNGWFKDKETVCCDIKTENAKDLNEKIELYKEIQNNNSIIISNKVSSIKSSIGTSLFCDSDNSYISSDPFSKLQYDDLRKVHKDETVFSTKKDDYLRMNLYESTEQIIQARNVENISPLDLISQEFLDKKSNSKKLEMLNKQHYVNSLQDFKYKDKNKIVLAHFMRLSN